MRRTAALLLAVLASVLVALVPATPAQACSCAEASPAEHFSAADVVFTARLAQRSVEDPARHVFEVEVVLKGTAHSQQAVLSPAESASCGLALRGTGPFAVFARQDGDGYRADSCGGTAALTPHLHSELALLGARSPGRLLPGGSPDAPWWTEPREVGGSALGLLAVAGLLLARRRVRRRTAAGGAGQRGQTIEISSR